MVADGRERVCANCLFFEALQSDEEDDLGGEYGQCRRAPPVLVEPGAMNGVWPVIREDNWCGEHDFDNDPSSL